MSGLVSARFTMSEWRRILEEKREEAEKIMAGPIKVGKIEDFPRNFFDFFPNEEASKIHFDGDDIILIGNESDFHEVTARVIGSEIQHSNYCKGHNLGYSKKSFFIVVNKFKSGCLAKKVPDRLFGHYDSDIPIISLEIAFKNKEIDRLYWELVHSLTEFTTIQIAIGMKIFPHQDDARFDALFFAMRRTVGNPPGSVTNPLGKPSIAFQNFKQEGIIPNYYCLKEREKEIPENFPPEKFPVGNLQEQQKLGVEIFFEHQINEENYEQDLTIPMESSPEGILIHDYAFWLIRLEYQKWWHESSPSQWPKSIK